MFSNVGRRACPAKNRHGASLDTAPEPDWSEWEVWLRSHLKRERAFLLEVVGSAIGEIVRKQHQEAKNELADAVRGLRIELAEAQTTIHELRAVIASERAQVVDMPSPLRPRSVN
jgi:hypothetical protein